MTAMALSYQNPDTPGTPATVIELSERLLWVDEFDYSPVVTEQRYSTNGALIVHIGERQAGRTITLDGKAGAAWVSRGAVVQLQALQAKPGAVFGLTLRGVTRQVLFIEYRADPVVQLTESELDGDTLYTHSLTFLEV